MRLTEKQKQEIVNQQAKELRSLIRQKKLTKAEIKRWQLAGIVKILQSITKVFQ